MDIAPVSTPLIIPDHDEDRVHIRRRDGSLISRVLLHHWSVLVSGTRFFIEAMAAKRQGIGESVPDIVLSLSWWASKGQILESSSENGWC